MVNEQYSHGPKQALDCDFTENPILPTPPTTPLPAPSDPRTRFVDLHGWKNDREVNRVFDLRGAGIGWEKIAAAVNAERVPLGIFDSRLMTADGESNLLDQHLHFDRH